MDIEKNNKYLASSSEYRTGPSLKKFSLFGSTFQFYAKLIRIIFYSNKQAKKGIYDDSRWIHSSLDILNSLEQAGIKFHFTGLHNLHSFEGAAVFIGNHMSTLETVILPGIIHPVKKVCFVVKKELTTYPLFGPVNNARQPIVVGRKNPRDDLKLVMEEGAKRLASGKSIIIFPQRTRSFTFSPKSFNTLGIKLAKQNNVPIVPVAILTDAWTNGKLIKEFGKIDISKKVRIAFGEPMNITGNGMEQHQKTIDFISTNLIDWGRKHYIRE